MSDLLNLLKNGASEKKLTRLWPYVERKMKLDLTKVRIIKDDEKNGLTEWLTTDHKAGGRIKHIQLPDKQMAVKIPAALMPKDVQQRLLAANEGKDVWYLGDAELCTSIHRSLHGLRTLFEKAV